MIKEFSPKTPGATPVLTMDFTDRLKAGETIQSATWTITEDQSGTDTSTAMLKGAIDTSASPLVRQQVQAGTDGTRYLHTCLATTSAGRVVDGVVGQLVTRRA